MHPSEPHCPSEYPVQEEGLRNGRWHIITESLCRTWKTDVVLPINFIPKKKKKKMVGEGGDSVDNDPIFLFNFGNLFPWSFISFFDSIAAVFCHT